MRRVGIKRGGDREGTGGRRALAGIGPGGKWARSRARLPTKPVGIEAWMPESVSKGFHVTSFPAGGNYLQYRARKSAHPFCPGPGPRPGARGPGPGAWAWGPGRGPGPGPRAQGSGLGARGPGSGPEARGRAPGLGARGRGPGRHNGPNNGPNKGPNKAQNKIRVYGRPTIQALGPRFGKSHRN